MANGLDREAERILTNGSGESVRINLASAGRYAVAVGGRIYLADTVERLRDRVAPLGWR